MCCQVRMVTQMSLAVRKPIVQNLLMYALATAIVYYVSRGISWTQVAEVGRHATLWMFFLASLGGFLCWFVGETLLYSRLFTYVHGPTRATDLLPTMAAVYFLQIVTSYLAAGALALFLRARKHVPWITAGCTLMFQGYLDAILLATLSLIAMVFVPTSPIRLGLNYAVGVVVLGCVIASFWLLWGSRLSGSNWLGWLYKRPAMVSFRLPRAAQYLELFAIRLLIVLAAGFALYGQFLSFHIGVPLIQTLALTPFIVAIGNSPFSPGGLGSTQLVFTLAFERFGSRADLFALSLAVTVFNLIVRVPMGLVMGAPLAAEVVEVEDESAQKRSIGQL
jgi:uncharacterized membrane protein YbhN (UPF0104 family)